MATELGKGQNAPLTAGQVQITVEVALPADISALLVTGQGKVRTDADFIFYNQPSAPGVTLRPQGPGGPAAIVVDVAAVPADIEKVRIVSSLDGSGQRFGSVAPPVAKLADQAGNQLISYVVSGLSTETIMIALELYRRAGQWKVRAVGQGYAGGLADLITDHGVVVDSGAAPAAAAVTPPPPPVMTGPPRTTPQMTPPPGVPQMTPPPVPLGQPPTIVQGIPPVPPVPYNAPPPMTVPQAPFPPMAQPAPPSMVPPSAPPTAPPMAPPTAPPMAPPTAQPMAQVPPSGEQSLGTGAPVNLRKGERVSLRKQDGAGLSVVRMGLGWDAIKKRSMFGSREVEVDLDASAIMFADRQPVDVVFYNHARSKDGSIMHTGDNRTGHGDGDDESIIVDLNRVPAHITAVFFVVTSYSGQTFAQIENAFCRLVDETNNRELVRYTLSGGTPCTATIMTKVYRDGNVWKMQAIGDGAQGKTPLDLVPIVGSML